MWIKTVIQLEEETQMLREKNLQLSLQSDEMIRSYEENKNLKKKLADAELELMILKDLLKKSYNP